MWTIRDVLAKTAEIIARYEPEGARLEAELLLAHVLGVRRIDLYADFARPLSEPELARYRAALLQRSNARLPIAYITGHREFYSLDLEVTRATLVPRPETEGLVEAALEVLAKRAAALPAGAPPALVADVGTGTGAIAIAIAKLSKAPIEKVYATDVSAEACEVARRNVAKHGLGEKVEVLEGDLLAPLAGRTFALIASNPPYVGERERASLAPEVLAEPPGALFSGPDGLDAIRRLIAGAPALLEPGGVLLVEHGTTQGQVTRALAKSSGFEDVATRKDLAGHDRLLVARTPRGAS